MAAPRTPADATPSAPWRVAVAGATGLIGGALLAQLSAAPGIGPVWALARSRGTARRWPTPVQPLAVDYATLGTPQGQPLPTIDLALCALGTTIQVAGSQAAFRAVDVDAVLAFARAARAAGAQRIGVVSALGADAGSSVFYNRCKGEAEDALRAMDWQALVLVRPSLLLGDRAALGQPTRRGEQIAQRLSPLLSRLVPARWRPISADTVARALLAAVRDPATRGVRVLESDELQRLGRG